MKKLFKITKELPVNWFVNTSTAIRECECHSELELIRNAIEGDLSSFYVSNKDKAGLMLLLAQANLKYRFLTTKIRLSNYKQSNQ